MDGIARIENLAYKDNMQIIIRGFAFIRGKELNRNTEKFFVIKNNNNKDIYIYKLNLQIRTDITFIYRDDNVDYSFSGFEDFKLDFKELLNLEGEYKAYIRVKDIQEYDIKLEVALAEIRNKFIKYYNKEAKKIIDWNFYEKKYVSLIIRDQTKNIFLKEKLNYLKKDLKKIKILIKNKNYLEIYILFLYLVIKLINCKKEIWILGERKDTAQDNSYIFFEYLCETEKEINAYYIIDKFSNDYKKVNNYKNIINWGSIRHTLYLLISKYSINSYSEKSNMYTNEYKNIIRLFPNIVNRKKIFLQHGVIGMSRLNHTLHKNRADIDLFFVSSDFEKKHIISEYGYKENEVIVSGLCRWDNLYENINTNKKVILIMPTWRNWIKTEKELLESDYFDRYINLLKNEKFLEIVKKNNYIVKVYFHYHIDNLIKNINLIFDKNVQIINRHKEDIQKLIKNSDILISDYSSVMFDFAYMGKPVILYQFDYKDFYNNHYNKGPIDKKDLFSLIGESEIEILKHLENICEGKISKKMHMKKTSKFIKNIDNNNCKRTFNGIKNLDIEGNKYE